MMADFNEYITNASQTRDKNSATFVLLSLASYHIVINMSMSCKDISAPKATVVHSSVHMP